MNESALFGHPWKKKGIYLESAAVEALLYKLWWKARIIEGSFEDCPDDFDRYLHTLTRQSISWEWFFETFVRCLDEKGYLQRGLFERVIKKLIEHVDNEELDYIVTE